jgi:hypothetical protein
MSDADFQRPKIVVGIDEMTDSCDACGGRIWDLFDSYKQLKDYIAWRETPDDTASTVVLLHKDKDKH